MLGLNQTLRIRGRRGQRFYEEDFPCHVFPASNYAVIDPAAADFRWAVHFDPDWTFPDGSIVAAADVLLWDSYPNQNLTLSNIQVNEGIYRVGTAYFMEQVQR